MTSCSSLARSLDSAPLSPLLSSMASLTGDDTSHTYSRENVCHGVRPQEFEPTDEHSRCTKKRPAIRPSHRPRLTACTRTTLCIVSYQDGTPRWSVVTAAHPTPPMHAEDPRSSRYSRTHRPDTTK